MSKSGKVAVLMGGRSAERDISLMSGRNVLEALRRKGVDAHAFDPAERELSDLKTERFERAFIVLHGRYGEDGTVQGALELMGIPHTGSDVLGSSLSMDKLRTKLVWLATGVPTPLHGVLTAASDFAGVAEDLGLPLIVKPVHEGSSIGLTKVTQVGELAAAYQLAARYDELVLAEEFIAGRELTVGFLGNRALPAVLIEAPEGNYDYHNKYFSDATQYRCPCGLAPAAEEEIQQLAMRAFEVLGCRGWGRVDLLLRDDGKPFFLEMNTCPGMTGHSLVPMAARAAGIEFDDLVVRILELAHAG